MLCSISGHVPQEPVISSKSGLLFEKRLVEKEIQENGLCPVTKEPLTAEDLIPVKTDKSVKPRPSSATSIPGLLGLFHNEWDALMLETHSLRQSLHTTRQELSHALYQQDAACRVIARLVRERDTALDALSGAQAAAKEAGKRAAEEDLSVPAKKARAGIPPEVGQELFKLSNKMSKARKKRVISESLASIDDISGYSLVSSHPLHKTSKGGIPCVALNPKTPGIVGTAGADGTVQIFDRASRRILRSLEEQGKRVNSLSWANEDILVTGSADKKVRVWQGGKCSSVFKQHSEEVVSVTSAAAYQYCISASKDRSLGFFDVNRGECLGMLSHSEVEAPYTCAQFHPDALLVGTGVENGRVHVWEMRGQTIAKTLDAESGCHSTPVKAVAFSENGYFMATCAADMIKLWDLRKLKVFRELTPYDSASISSLCFDTSGLYLAVGGEDARIYGVKQDWSVVKSFPDVPKKGVYSLAFDVDAASLLVGASDHNLRVFGKEQ